MEVRVSRERATGIEEHLWKAARNVVQKKAHTFIAFSFPSVSINDCREMKRNKFFLWEITIQRMAK